MTNYEIQEMSRKLIDNGFSVNASAAIIMWSKYHTGLTPPYLFTSKSTLTLDESINLFSNMFESNWIRNNISGYIGGLDLTEGVSPNRFKTGFIDVLTLSEIFEKCYRG